MKSTVICLFSAVWAIASFTPAIASGKSPDNCRLLDADTRTIVFDDSGYLRTQILPKKTVVFLTGYKAPSGDAVEVRIPAHKVTGWIKKNTPLQGCRTAG